MTNRKAPRERQDLHHKLCDVCGNMRHIDETMMIQMSRRRLRMCFFCLEDARNAAISAAELIWAWKRRTAA